MQPRISVAIALKMLVAMTIFYSVPHHLVSATNLAPVLINASSIRLKRDYGGYDGSYGYSSSGGSYGGGGSYGHSCCACESSSPLLFFGLGALLGLLLAMPMMMNTMPTVAINPPPRNKRLVEIKDEKKKFGMDAILTAFNNVKEQPECASKWICEMYKMAEEWLPESAKWLLNYARKSSVNRSEFAQDDVVCGNQSPKTCGNLLPT